MTTKTTKTFNASPDPDDPLALVGQTIDDVYRIDALVGEGGFGVVYRAFHLKFQHPIAVKCLKIPSALEEATRADFLRKFQEEGRLLFQLSQGSFEIVRAIALGDTVTPTGIWTPFVVLEWLDGTALDRLLARRRAARQAGMPIGRVVAWLDKPARALAYAHRMHVAHRDIKPANLFVLDQRDDRDFPIIKVLDFGIAKVVEHGSPTSAGGVSKTSFSSFTPQYAAPEQFNPTLGNTGPWTDVYSFALVMVEMFSGRPAVQGKTAYELMKLALDEQRRPTPRTVGVEVSDAVEKVFQQALQLNPRKRYPSMGAFWSDLTSVLESSNTKVREVSKATKNRTVAMVPPQPNAVSSSSAAPPARVAPSGLPTPPSVSYPSSPSEPHMGSGAAPWGAPSGPVQPLAQRPDGNPPYRPDTYTPAENMPAVGEKQAKRGPGGWVWLSFGILLGIVLVILVSGAMCTTCLCISTM